MKEITFAQMQNNFEKVMNQSCEDRKSILITRKNAEPVVMLSLKEYSSMEETLYLLRSPKRDAIDEGIASFKRIDVRL